MNSWCKSYKILISNLQKYGISLEKFSYKESQQLIAYPPPPPTHILLHYNTGGRQSGGIQNKPMLSML